jgi:hypothetical protein
VEARKGLASRPLANVADGSCGDRHQATKRKVALIAARVAKFVERDAPLASHVNLASLLVAAINRCWAV